MAATATQAAPAPKLARGISLPCPCCGEQQANIALNLGDIDGDESLQCRECDATFDLSRIRDIIAAWGPIMRWIDTMPSDDAE